MSPDISESHLLEIFNKLRTSFFRDSPPSYQKRIEHLKRLHTLLIKNQERLIAALISDFGHRNPHETRFEIFSVLEEIKYAKRHLKRWMKPRKRRVSIWFKFAYTKIIPQPLGVVGIIAPWNGPLALSLSPLVGVLAAGNKAMIKASELVPCTGKLLAELLLEYFADDPVILINGDAEIGKSFANLPFDHLLFTGSAKVARTIMRAASNNLTPVTLELGGKSPVIIGKNVDLENAVERIIFGKLANSGQICLAPDYVLLPKAVKTTFIKLAKKTVKKFYPEIENNPDYTNIINRNHYQRLQSYLEDAKDQGAKIIPLLDGVTISSSNKMAPMLVCNTTQTMQIMQAEIFGPFLPILIYDQIQEAVDYINARPKPLGIYYFGNDQREITNIINHTYSAGVSINSLALYFFQTNLPFGGVGESGMGHYHGEYGFNTFSKLKPIFYQRGFTFTSLLYPPHKKIIDWILRVMVR